MLGPTVQREKDTTHKTFETMFIARAWPQQCRKSCANGSNVVVLRFGDQGIKEMLGVVGLEVWPVSKLCATTRRKQHATGCSNGRDNVGNYWPTILRIFILQLRCLLFVQCFFFLIVEPPLTDSKSPCKRTPLCWPTPPNIVSCYMLRPLAHPVACCWNRSNV